MSDQPMARRWLPAIAFMTVLGLTFVLLPKFYGNSSLLFTMMTFVVLAQGLNLLYGFTGYLPFGYVGFFGAGAYGASILVLHTHLPILVCIAGGAAASVLMAIILGPLLRLSGAYFSIANLAASQVLYFIVSNPHLSAITGGPYGLSIERMFAPKESYLAMLALMLLTVALAAWLRLSRFGMALQAIRQDATSAAMAGVHVVRERFIAWLLSAAVAGLAGGIYAWNLSVFYPDAVFTLSISVYAIVFALFGGVGTVIGPVLGAIVLYAFYNAIGLSSPQYFELFYGILIVLLVLFLPNGIAALLKRWGLRVF